MEEKAKSPSKNRLFRFLFVLSFSLFPYPCISPALAWPVRLGHFAHSLPSHRRRALSLMPPAASSRSLVFFFLRSPNPRLLHVLRVGFLCSALIFSLAHYQRRRTATYISAFFHLNPSFFLRTSHTYVSSLLHPPTSTPQPPPPSPHPRRQGIRTACLVTAALLVLSCSLRVITVHLPAVTWLTHAGQIFNGLAGPVAMSLGPSLSAAWFPVNQRVTATAIVGVANYIGLSLSFVLGPLMVPERTGQHAGDLKGIKHDVRLRPAAPQRLRGGRGCAGHVCVPALWLRSPPT